MKKIILYSLVSTGVLLMTGCSEAWNAGLGGEGKIVPIVDLDTETVSSRGDKQARSNAAGITVDDLELTLTSTKDGSQRRWNSLGEFDASEKFNVGTYTMEASYGVRNADGFEKPFYYGVTSVAVRENETTNVSLTASLANSMLTITYTDAFVGYFSDYSVDVKTINGTTTYSRAENRPVYVTPGSVTLAINVVKPNGVAQTYNATVSAKARYHHHVALDVNGGNVGDASLTITFDDTLDQEDIVIDLSKDLTNTPAPTLIGEGFENGAELTTVEGVALGNKLSMIVMAKGGIGSLMLTTESTSLAEQGWPKTVDLMGTAAATRATMTSLGFEEHGLWQNPEQMAMIDLTSVVSKIKYITGFDNKSTFTLSVTDVLGQTAESNLSFSVVVEKLQLNIISAEAFDYTSRGTIEFEYNGADAQKDIAFEALNARGVYESLTVESIEPKSRGLQTYVAHVDGLVDDMVHGTDDVKIRAIVTDSKGNRIGSSGEFTITRTPTPFSLNIEDNNVFANRAYATISNEVESVEEFVKRVKLMVSTDNGATFSEYNFTPEGDYYKIEGLNPGTAYKARLSADGKVSRLVPFTTEKALPLPNGDMEDWSITDSESNWERYAVTGWATYNRMTTMKTGTRHNTAYVSRSGTAESTDAHSGLKAAELRTIGWGAGNGAYGSISGNNPKYIHQGKLYLGQDAEKESELASVKQGVDFASRPRSISFWYKFIPFNQADYGGMRIWVKDIDGNIIAQGNATNLNEKVYTNVTVSLDYSFGTKKANELFVEFVSSDSPEYATRNKSWFTVPSFGDMSDGKFQGSSLLIDDITLNY